MGLCQTDCQQYQEPKAAEIQAKTCLDRTLLASLAGHLRLANRNYVQQSSAATRLSHSKCYGYPEYRIGNLKTGRPSFFIRPAAVWPGQKRHPPAGMPAVSGSAGLPRRMSPKPESPDRRRRTGLELFVPRIQNLLCARIARNRAARE